MGYKDRFYCISAGNEKCLIGEYTVGNKDVSISVEMREISATNKQIFTF